MLGCPHRIFAMARIGRCDIDRIHFSACSHGIKLGVVVNAFDAIKLREAFGFRGITADDGGNFCVACLPDGRKERLLRNPTCTDNRKPDF